MQSAIFAMALPMFSLVIAIVALFLSQRAYNTSPRKRQLIVFETLEEHDARLVRVEAKWKKLNANYASLRAAIGKKPTEDMEDDEIEHQNVDTGFRKGETPAEWKHRMRQKIAGGWRPN